MAVNLAALLQQLRRDDAKYDADLEPEVDERDVEDDKGLRCASMRALQRLPPQRLTGQACIQHICLHCASAGSRPTWSEAWS